MVWGRGSHMTSAGASGSPLLEEGACEGEGGVHTMHLSPSPGAPVAHKRTLYM